MSLEISGKVVRILPEQTGNGRNGAWVKQEFVIETSGDQFPKKICIAAWGDKAEEVKQLTPGEDIKVYFNIESREYNDKWYTDVKAWKIETGQGQASQPAYAGAGASSSRQAPPVTDMHDFTPAQDDLPF
jgi:hypothetical protein